jgi:Lipase (class 3)
MADVREMAKNGDLPVVLHLDNDDENEASERLATSAKDSTSTSSFHAPTTETGGLSDPGTGVQAANSVLSAVLSMAQQEEFLKCAGTERAEAGSVASGTPGVTRRQLHQLRLQRYQRQQRQIQQLIDLPINAYDFIQLFMEHRVSIEKKIKSTEEYELYASILESVVPVAFETVSDLSSSIDGSTSVPAGQRKAAEITEADKLALYKEILQSIELVHFQDTKSDEECVFGMILNHKRKIVHLTFRGSVTPRDFLQDAKSFFTPIPNPVRIPSEALQHLFEAHNPLHHEQNVVKKLGTSGKEASPLPRRSAAATQTAQPAARNADTVSAPTSTIQQSTQVQIATPTSSSLAVQVDPRLIRSQSDTVLVHLGFREYLYGESVFLQLPRFLKSVSGIVSSATGKIQGMLQTQKSAVEEVPGSPSSDQPAADTDMFNETETEFRLPLPGENSRDVGDDIETDHVKPYTNPKACATGRAEVTIGTTAEEEWRGKMVDAKLTSPMSCTEGDTVDRTPRFETADALPELQQKTYKVILQMLSAIFRKHPDYHLYVTGHSLGGALATMFSVEAAAAGDANEEGEYFIPKPVNCVTVGAPKVGNLDFLRAFEILEEQNKLRYIRVVNYRDIVPLSPPQLSHNCACLFCPRRRFRHVGLRLKLFPHGYVITYSPRARTCLGLACFDCLKILRHYLYLLILCPITCLCKNLFVFKVFMAEHSIVLYMKRFDQCRPVLEKLSLDQLYQERKARARWKLPTLHGDTHMFVRDEYSKKPYLAANIVLDV